MKRTSQSVRLQTGVTLEYIEQGDSSGLPVILLHGISDTMWSYELLMDHLPSDWHVFAVTQRGHGGSSKPSTGYSLPDFAQDLAAFLDAQNIPAALLVGHSMSTFIVQQFAKTYPQRVLGLVLIGAFYPDGTNAVLRESEPEISQMSGPITHEFADAFQRSTIGQPLPPGFLEMTVSETMKMPGEAFRDIWSELVKDHTAQSPMVTAPTFLIWGAKETITTRADQDNLLRTIPGSRLVIYENAGHATHWEEPQRAAEDIIHFVAERRISPLQAEIQLKSRAV